MKTDKIMVGVNGAVLALSSGKKAIAVYPAGTGEKSSYLLIQDGTLAVLKGSRINGVGAARFFKEQGFVPAPEGDKDAESLAEMVDVSEGIALVEANSSAFAQELGRKFGGQVCNFVPFSAENQAVPVTVRVPNGMSCRIIDFSSVFSAGLVPLEYSTGGESPYMEANLSKGWLVDSTVLPETLPRNTEYGGVVEHAVFVVCNSGMGHLCGAKNLEMNEHAAVDARYPKGEMEIALDNGDLLTVGIDASDNLGVDYTRKGEILYSRSGLGSGGASPLKLGSVVGTIAAVIVRVQEMDAKQLSASKKSRKKA